MNYHAKAFHHNYLITCRNLLWLQDVKEEFICTTPHARWPEVCSEFYKNNKF